MYIVRQKDYDEMKNNFFAKHHNDFKLETLGSSAEYYRKTYIFKDGAVWYEVMLKQTVEKEVEVNFCNVHVSIDMLQTEFFNNEDSKSYFYYEVWDNRR